MIFEMKKIKLKISDVRGVMGDNYMSMGGWDVN